MISVLLCWLALGYVIYLLYRWAGDSDGRLAVSSFLIVLLFFGVPIGLAFLGEALVVRETYISENQLDIVVIRDNSLIEGRVEGGIFIVSGYVRESPAYFYYKKVGKGYTQDSIIAKGVTIFEDSPEGIGYVVKTRTWTEVTPSWKKSYLHWILFQSKVLDKTTYEIHIPKGSIVKEFVLDAS